MIQNKALIFKAIPTAWPKAGEHITIEAHRFDPDEVPPPGGFTARVHYISFDPYQRGRMRDPEIKSYAPPYEVGKPLTSHAIISILKSDGPDFKPKDIVYGPRINTEEYTIVSPAIASQCRVVDNPYNLDAELFIGALGMPGLTAYSSYHEIGLPKKGETIFISAASGAVGQLVGQLAKHNGLKVIGSVGSDEKLDFITKELDFDGGFNYKKEKPLQALIRLAPDGIDVYYENVGGEQLEAAITHMNTFGRIVVCGMVSQYNKPPDEMYGVKNLIEFFSKRIKMQGFLVYDSNMGPKYFDEHQKNVQRWIHEGKFKVKQSVTHGIDQAAEGLVGMLEGKNFGKAVLEVCPL